MAEPAALAAASQDQVTPAVVKQGVEKLEAVLEEIPQPARKIALQMVKVEAHSGPLPAPQILEGYRAVMPDLPERIVTRFEKQSNHRMENEAKLVDARIAQTDRAQWFVFFLVVLIISAAVLVALNGHPWLAGIMVTSTIASILGAFLLKQLPSGSAKRPKSESADAELKPMPGQPKTKRPGKSNQGRNPR